MKALIVAACALALTACAAETPIEAYDGGGNDGRTVDLMAIAPDGTKLWRFGGKGLRHPVYFASSGTSQVVNCGKNCVKNTQVATAIGE